ncbi:cell division protein FtsB [Flavobacteriaceae bacterium (ex Bugula neritina AB1)]|nr:cell division protein FtsB [Flavobacteriaceae bacterium (ex Bugula neritina AB1)]
MQFYKSLYFTNRMFYALAILTVLFLLSYWFRILYPLTWLFVWGMVIATLFDIVILYNTKNGVIANRLLPDKFSNSDFNAVPIRIRNNYPFTIYTETIDEIPVQFQKRDFLKKLSILPKSIADFEYSLRPVKRGKYVFGSLNIYVMTKMNLVKRRYNFDSSAVVKVYPSFIQMKKYDFLAINNKLTQFGVKKIRRIGHTMEFEQIKEYIIGDDVRTINWKASAKQGNLMINQFQDEKSQPIYSIIDASRVMKMPFKELSLLDYAVNSALAFSNIALKKHDKVGVLTFSNTVHNFLPSNRKKTYINTISESLYNIKTQFLDSDFDVLYGQIKRQVNHRSLLLLYTNFEHISALKRQLPYLKALAKKHVLVVIFFENTELNQLIHQKAEDLQTIYDQTIAQQFAYDKKIMAKELHKYGIQSVLTKPEDLTINTINKYLEIKARGLL